MARRYRRDCFGSVITLKKTEPKREPLSPHLTATAAKTPKAPRPEAPDPIWERVTDVNAEDSEFQQCYVISTGEEHNRAGRISVTNIYGQVVYDVFVYYPDRPDEIKKNHPPTKGFGVTWDDLKPEHNARPISEVEANLRKIFEGRVIVGHAIGNDMKVVSPWVFDGIETRDTQQLPLYRSYARGPRYLPALKHLARIVLGRNIQGPEHSSVEDARATMDLYLEHREEFDRLQAGEDHRCNMSWSPLDPDDTETEQEAMAREQRQHQRHVAWQEQRHLDHAESTKLPLETVTPWRYAAEFWEMGVEIITDNLLSVKASVEHPLMPVLYDASVACPSTGDWGWPYAGGNEVREPTSTRHLSPLTRWARAIAPPSRSEEEWDSRLLADLVEPRQDMKFPHDNGTRVPRCGARFW